MEAGGAEVGVGFGVGNFSEIKKKKQRSKSDGGDERRSMSQSTR